MDKINLKEILNHVYDEEFRYNYKIEYSEQCILKAMKESCNQVLKLAADNAKMDVVVLRRDEIAIEFGNVINKQSILNTINEVE